MEPKEIKVEEANLEADIPKCDCCDGHFNHSDHSDKHVEEVLKKKLCDCPDEPMEPIEEIKYVKEFETKNDGIQMTIEEIDHTEKPEFIDYCSDCGGGIMKEGLTKHLYEKWKEFDNPMTCCECVKTDEESGDSDFD